MNYITGASGFIGSHLTKQLEATSISHDKIQETILEPFDNFYFLSSYGNLNSHTDEDAIYRANITDLVSILMQVKDMQFKSFVYLSSSSVKLKTQTTYSRCKKAAEEILLAVMERHNLPICIIRPFSVTGVGEQPEHFIPLLIRSAYSNQMVNLSPRASHDFIDVSDVVSGIKMLSEKGARGIFDLGTGIKTTNKEVFDLVQEVTKKPIHANTVDNLRPYDNEDWVSTNFKARGYGWLPKVTLKESITQMVKEYDEEWRNQGV